MNGITKVGQQVVCINADWTSLKHNQAEALRLAGLTNGLPVLNGVYTVRSFVREEVEEPFIELAEIGMRIGIIAFSTTRFRPLVTVKKNPHVTAMIEKYTKPKQRA